MSDSIELKKRSQRAIARVKDYKQIFSTRAGKRVLADLIEVHYVLKPLFHPTNQHLSSLREGERNTVLRILSLLKMDPIKMREYIEEKQDERYDI